MKNGQESCELDLQLTRTAKLTAGEKILERIC